MILCLDQILKLEIVFSRDIRVGPDPHLRRSDAMEEVAQSDGSTCADDRGPKEGEDDCGP